MVRLRLVSRGKIRRASRLQCLASSLHEHARIAYRLEPVGAIQQALRFRIQTREARVAVALALKAARADAAVWADASVLLAHHHLANGAEVAPRPRSVVLHLPPPMQGMPNGEGARTPENWKGPDEFFSR